MSAAQHINEIEEQGWTRIDLTADEWVALVPNEQGNAYGGTLWKRGSDGFDHAEGCTAGHPFYATLNFEAAAKQIAAQIKMEIGS
jgi:hypothetical protein